MCQLKLSRTAYRDSQMCDTSGCYRAALSRLVRWCSCVMTSMTSSWRALRWRGMRSTNGYPRRYSWCSCCPGSPPASTISRLMSSARSTMSPSMCAPLPFFLSRYMSLGVEDAVQHDVQLLSKWQPSWDLAGRTSQVNCPMIARPFPGSMQKFFVGCITSLHNLCLTCVLLLSL